MNMEDNLSSSRISEYTGCGYKYWFHYMLGQVSRVDDPAPTLGSAGHAGMAAGILGNSVDQALEEWKQNYVKSHSMYNMVDPEGKIDENVNRIIEDMVDDVIHETSLIVPRALDHLHLEDWETIVYKDKPLVETKFLVPIPGWKGLVMVLDWVAKYKPTGMAWVIDHKFRKQLQAEETEETNIQMPIYQGGLLQMGIPTIGSMTNQILAKLPSLPKLNKDGSMSRAKIATTWDIYRQALLDNRLNPADYEEDMKGKLTTEFFRCNYEYRSQMQIINTWNEVVLRAADDMANHPSFIRNLGQLGCRNCWVKDYCLEELRGGDLEYLLRTQYMPRSLAHHDMEYFEMETEEGGEE